MNTNLYHDIALRTDSNIYIGVVGPVRTGKSTFIKRFMETLVIPNIENVYLKERAKDELPQSGSGKTIMTAEPKFIPEDAVGIRLGNDTEVTIRLIDCVGYMIEGATGRFENGEERMVSTPWYDHEISMTEAAETGTRKVITDHSTIGLVVTTDGSVCGIPREEYLEAEKRVIDELKAIGKPFVVLVNSSNPDGENAKQISERIQTDYQVGALCVNCKELSAQDVTEILRRVLIEFPTECIKINLPTWVESLPFETPILQSVLGSIKETFRELSVIKAVYPNVKDLLVNENISDAIVSSIDLGSGTVCIDLEVPRSLYFETITQQSGFEVSDDGELLELLRQLREIKADYRLVEDALRDVRSCGYGIVQPRAEDLRLEVPEVVKQGGKYAVKMKANAPAIHMIMTNIETTVMPTIGGENTSGEIVNLLLQGLDGDIERIWDSNLFGKSLYDIAGEGVHAKIEGLSLAARGKFQETLQRVINEGAGGLICIIL